jgi:translation initiation factor IF-3
MGFTKYTTQAEKQRVRMNEGITVPEVRCLGPEGENFGIMSTREAFAKARELGLDLIEITPNATPPVAKIIDYGKYTYEQKKKEKEVKAKSHITETKVTQVKIGTSSRDMQIKATKAAEWLREGHRVRVDLFLWGRYKYMEFTFLKDRLERFLVLIDEPFKIAEPIAKGPKGLACAIERDKSGKRFVPSSASPVKEPAGLPTAPETADSQEDAPPEE